uniref:Lipoprotein n=1 Tax=Nitrosopumivirus cobalaminus TaxID=3158414 RepID=A0AAU7N490_9VIRU
MNKSIFGIAALAALVACVGLPADAFASDWHNQNSTDMSLNMMHEIAQNDMYMLTDFLVLGEIEPTEHVQTSEGYTKAVVASLYHDMTVSYDDNLEDEDCYFTVSGLEVFKVCK